MFTQGGMPRETGFNWITFFLGFIVGVLTVIILAAIVAAIFWFIKRRSTETEQSKLVSKKSKFELKFPDSTELSDLDQQLLQAIGRNITVKQSKLPRMVNQPRSSVSESLIYLEENDLITRKKEGRTYIIELSNSLLSSSEE